MRTPKEILPSRNEHSFITFKDAREGVRLAVRKAVDEAKAAYREKSFLGPAGWTVDCDVADEAIDDHFKGKGY